jgi:hypothetical protein
MVIVQKGAAIILSTSASELVSVAMAEESAPFDFDAFDTLEGLAVTEAPAEPLWITTMARFRAATTLPERITYMKALCELGRHRFYGDRMREDGVIDFAIETLRTLDPQDSECALLITWTARCVRRVICPNRLNRRRVREVDGLPVLIRVLDCPEEAAVLEASHALKNVTYGHGLARDQVRELGGVHALMRVLLNPKFDQATWRAAVALCSVSWANPMNRDLIATTPGVMAAIEGLLGRKADHKTAVGLKALRKHIRLRAEGADVEASVLDSEHHARGTADVIAALNGVESESEESEEDEEEEDDGEKTPAADRSGPRSADTLRTPCESKAD